MIYTTPMLKTAIIGCGRVSDAHLQGFACNADLMFMAAACDLSLPRTEAAVSGYLKHMEKTAQPPLRDAVPAPQAFTDYRAMLEQVRPDMVTIATESGKHAEIAIECLESGCNVICEKPMALSTADADAMIAAAKRSGKTLGVCFQNRFNQPVQKLRAALEAGRLGRILHGMAQVRWRREAQYYAGDAWRGTWAQDGGALMNQCIHGIDLLQWMLGEDAVRIQAQTRRFMRPIEAEDFGAAVVEFKSGAVGIIEGTVDVYGGDLGVTLSVFGEQGTVVIGGGSASKMETWRVKDEADGTADTSANASAFVAANAAANAEVQAASGEGPNGVYGSGHRALFRNVAQAINTGGKPLVSGEDGKKAVELILAIYQSQKTGEPVELPCDFSTLEMAGEFDK